MKGLYTQWTQRIVSGIFSLACLVSTGPLSAAGPVFETNDAGRDYPASASSHGASNNNAVVATATADRDINWDAGPCGDPNYIGGKVYREFLSNGTADAAYTETEDVPGNAVGNQTRTIRNAEPPIAGVTVNVYDMTGALIGTDVSDAAGDWSVNAAAAATSQLRVEFIPPAGYEPGPLGGNNSTSVRVANRGDCGVDFTIQIPADHCENDPRFSVVCFARNNDGSTEPVIIDLAYNTGIPFVPISTIDNTKNWATPNAPASASTGYPVPSKTMVAGKGQVNTVFGLAWDKYQQQLYAGTYRRAFGPMSSNASANTFGEAIIYAIPYGSAVPSTPAVWLDLETLFGDGFAGSHVNDPNYPGPTQFGRTGNNPNSIGYTGLGSIKVSRDGSQMYVVNLKTAEVLVIPIGPGGTAPTLASQIKRFPIPTNECPAGTFAGSGNPYYAVLGLGVHPVTGRVYVTLTCTGPTVNDLKGFVYSFDPSDNTPSASDFTKELEIPLNHAIPATNPNVNPWYGQKLRAWVNVGANSTPLPNNSSDAQYTMPWLGEVDFDFQPNGAYAMVIGTRNRYHDMINSSFYVTGGILYRATNSGTEATPVWGLENNGTAGPLTSIVNWSFSPSSRAGVYTSDQSRFFKYVGREGSMMAGTFQILPNFHEVVAPTMDNVYHSGTSGIAWLKLSDGDRSRDNRILSNYTSSGYSATNFTKSNNWAGITARCGLPPLEVGNLVWQDTDEDGVQDPNEPGIAGLTLELWVDTNGDMSVDTKVAETTTDAQGHYLFSHAGTNAYGQVENWSFYASDGDQVEPGKKHEVRLPIGQVPLNGYLLTTANSPASGGNASNDNKTDLRDSDGSLIGQNATIAFATGNWGENNHTLDYGFKPSAACSVSLTATPGPCVPATNVHSVTGTITFANPPATGTMTVSSGGASQSFSAPFSSPQAYTLNGINSDGASHTVTVSFSADPSCSGTFDYTAPASCTPPPPGGACSVGSGVVGGKVHQDYNYNGVKDVDEPGKQGITVRIYACDPSGASVLVSVTTTDANGDYFFSGLTDGVKYKIEFDSVSIAGMFVKPTFFGTDNGTTVQFATAPTCDVDLGIANPADYCQVNPPIILPCYEPGNAVYGANGNTGKGIISLPYNSSGPTPTGITGVANIHEVGTVWGMAWQASTARMFTSAFLKRHSGLGPKGIGGVYVMDFSSGTGSVVNSFDLQGVVPANGGPAINLGAVLRTGSADYTLPNNNTGESIDLDAFPNVGKVSFGDCDMGPDGQTLWLINLNQRALISVDVSSTASYPGTVKQYPLSGFSGLPSCNNGQLRPWGLKFANGKGYVGCVCTGEDGGGFGDLEAFVLSFDPSNPTAFTTEITFGLDYLREKVSDFPVYGLNEPGAWNPWADTWAETGIGNNPGSEEAFPQPVLSDIEFSDNGSMILAFTDRFGHQAGYNQRIAVAGATQIFSVDAGGDIVHVCNIGNSWVLEGTGACTENDNSAAQSSLNNDGPGGTGEFYYGDSFDDTSVAPTYNHNETALGALVVVKGKNEVASIHFDPINDPTAFDQGILWFNTTTGARVDEFRIIASGPASNKGNGLGDMEAGCVAPIQIGQYVWIDNNKDGIQDPCEQPLPGVNVNLYKNGSLVASTTTDANGQYFFSAQGAPGQTWVTPGDFVKPYMDYKIVFGTGGQYDNTTGALTIAGQPYYLTVANSVAGTGNDQNDSDAALMSIAGGTYPSINVTTKGPGSGDHTLDAGYA
ncbi:MAG: hypothetical protein KDC61_05245, partial [Saprospiraceae bacterium]|nr:hypothetical protein [Saprospiraceae bacterium]